jgi:hypothetical protein
MPPDFNEQPFQIAGGRIAGVKDIAVIGAIKEKPAIRSLAGVLNVGAYSIGTAVFIGAMLFSEAESPKRVRRIATLLLLSSILTMSIVAVYALSPSLPK